MMSAKIATIGLSKILVFPKGHDHIISVADVTNKDFIT